MIDEMKRGRMLTPMPILTCDLEEAKKERQFSIQFNKIRLRNIGTAPALDTKVHLQLSNAGNTWLAIPSQEWLVSTFGLEMREWELPEAKPRLDDLQPPRVNVTVEYNNIYGMRLRTVAEFEYPSVDDADITELVGWDWKKLTEEIHTLS